MCKECCFPSTLCLKAVMERHLATCWFCLNARSQLLHVPVIKSKYIWLQCGYCHMRRSWGKEFVIKYPCGWLESHPELCMCTYLDQLGWNLNDNDLIFFVPRTNSCLEMDKYRKKIRELRIHHIRAGSCTFIGKSGAMSDYIYDIHGILCVSEIISVKPFQHIYHLAQRFLKNTRPKLQTLRANSMILKSLHFGDIKCLSRVSASTMCILLSSPDSFQMTDATLTKGLTKTNDNS